MMIHNFKDRLSCRIAASGEDGNTILQGNEEKVYQYWDS